MSKGKNMIKDKKKLSDPNAKKSQSSYQAGKTSVSNGEMAVSNKKK
jgi:hypothetical protein